jgi:adenine-specific DNA-methyltransferase
MTNNIDYDKLRGGYYTPKPIADFLSDWAIQRNDSVILEPSSGDGVFVESSVKKLYSLGFNGNNLNDLLYPVELDPAEAAKILPRIKRYTIDINDDIIKNEDFFTIAKQHLVNQRKFDCVVGNPPFIRYQNFVEEYRKIAFELMRDLGLNPNRLTNIWVPFIVVSSSLLRHRGRLAMVIPAELFQVNYAGQTRKFLTDHFSKINIVTFKKLLFPKIQQEVVLLLAEKNGGGATTISTIEVEDVNNLSSLNLDNDPSIEAKEMIHSKDKWTYYFLSRENIRFLQNIENHYRYDYTGAHIDVDVGVVTGQNKFFILRRSDVKKYNLRWNVCRILTRSPHLRGISFDDSDWEENNRDNYPMYLFMPPDKDYQDLRDDVQRYIDFGEKQDYHTGYKCRIRKRWYISPSVWIPDAFMLRQVHQYPRLILNNVNATCTDTIHRVRFLSDINPQQLAAGFLNSLTFAFSELIGRSYGGGVMTFEPTECERLPFPTVGIERLDFGEISSLQRKGDIDAVLNITDRILLIEGLGMTESEAKKLRKIWKILRDRRIDRKHRK